MWSEQQGAAIQAVLAWAKSRGGKQVFKLFGYAGSGKTTMAKEIARHVGGSVVFKGCATASTIHSLIYKVEEQPDGSHKFRLNSLSLASVAKLIIIDEVSMVGQDLGKDLLSFGTKVLVLGDPEQLPPVHGTGYFTAGEPDVMLTEIHRQARDNPIIRMSMDVREGRKLCVGAYGDSRIITRRELDPDQVLAADQLLVGMNKTRRTCNARIRQLNEMDGTYPIRNDRLVCLKNDRTRGLLNGSLWSTESADAPDDSGIVKMKVRSLDDPSMKEPASVYVPREFFTGEEASLDRNRRRNYDEFDFGYALTVHKSQGSQWNNVMLIDESDVFREDRRKHLYTGITRAAEKITLVQ